MLALIRYLGSDVLRAQRWAAPLLLYLAAVWIITPSQGPVLPTYAMSAAALFPVAIWLTVVVSHSEEPAQAAITMAIVGGPTRVWLARLATAYLFCAVLAAVALVEIPLSTPEPVGGAAIGVGILDHAMTAAAGVALGMLISRPIVPRLAWTVLLGTGICLAQLLVAHTPPVHTLLKLYNGRSDPPASALLLIAAETVVLVTVTIAAATVAARRRT